MLIKRLFYLGSKQITRPELFDPDPSLESDKNEWEKVFLNKRVW